MQWSTSVCHIARRSVMAYKTTAMPIYTSEALANSAKISLYDSIDSDVLASYSEFALSSMLFFAMKEGACSEQSSRMTSMDSASKNASEYCGSINMGQPQHCPVVNWVASLGQGLSVAVGRQLGSFTRPGPFGSCGSSTGWLHSARAFR